MLLLATLFAGGYYVGDIAAAATGQAGAFVAAPETPAAIWYNPGALTAGRGLRLELDGGLIHSPLHFEREGDFDAVDNEEPFQPAGMLVAVHDLGVPRLAVALGVFTPASNHYAYSEAGAQRYQSVDGENYLVHAHLAVAYQVHDKLSLGVAFGGSWFYATQRSLLSGSLADVDAESPAFAVPVELTVHDPFTFTCNFGMSVTPAPWISLGISAMPPFDVSARGHAEIELPALLGAFSTVDGDRVRADIAFPAVVRGGARVRRGTASLEAAVVWEGWSRLRAIHVTPDIRVSAPVLGLEDMALPTLDLVKEYRDVVSFRLGGEWAIDEIVVRGGAWFETAGSAPSLFDITTPESTKLGLAVGASWALPFATFDLSYQHVFAERVTVTDSAVGVTNVIEPANTRIVGNGSYDYGYDVLHAGVRLAY
jgi:long-subunit fatty acid transport protein